MLNLKCNYTILKTVLIIQYNKQYFKNINIKYLEFYFEFLNLVLKLNLYRNHPTTSIYENNDLIN